MKTDTKKMSPLKKVAPTMMTSSPEDTAIYYNPNKLIPDAATSLDVKKKEEKVGLLTRFQVILSFTPVKRSARLPSRAGTVDATGVEALVNDFAKITMKEETKEEEEGEGEELLPTATKKENDAAQDEHEASGKTEHPKLGRYETFADTHKSEKVPVIRSYRLAVEDEECKE